MNRDDERVDDAMLQRCEPGEAQARRHGSGPKPKGSRGKKNGKPPRPELATTTRKTRGADKPESRTHRTLGSPRTREIFRHTTIVLSGASFVAAALLGSALALALGGFGGSSILAFAPAHALLAIIAFGSATVVAIAYRFVPMFALAHTQGRKFQRLPQWLVLFAGVGGAAAIQNPLVLRVALAITLVAAAAAAQTHLQTLRARMRRTSSM